MGKKLINKIGGGNANPPANNNSIESPQKTKNPFEVENIIKQLKFIILILYIMIILNGIKKIKLQEIKNETSGNGINKVEFLSILFKKLWTIPLTLTIYWVLLIIVIEIFQFFIKFLLVTPKGEGSNEGEGSKNNQETLSGTLWKEFMNDGKLLIIIFGFNLLLIFLIWLFIILPKKKEKHSEELINNDFINIVYNIYYFALILSIIVIYLNLQIKN